MDLPPPTSWADAVVARAEDADAVPIADETDVLVEINRDHRRPARGVRYARAEFGTGSKRNALAPDELNATVLINTGDRYGVPDLGEPPTISGGPAVAIRDATGQSSRRVPIRPEHLSGV